MHLPNPYVGTVEVAKLTGRTVAAIQQAIYAEDVPPPMRIGHAFLWRREQMSDIVAGLRERAARGNRVLDIAPEVELASI